MRSARRAVAASGTHADDGASRQDLVELLDRFPAHPDAALAPILADTAGIARAVKPQTAVGAVEVLPRDPSRPQGVLRISERDGIVTCPEPHGFLGLFACAVFAG